MWKSWKEKIIDFFYEEVETEEKSIPEQIESDSVTPLNQRLLKQDNQHVDSKVTYQYPNQQQVTAFRVPVSPNQPKRKNRVNSPNQQAIKRKLQAKNKTYQARQENNMRINGYKRKKNHKELENVPAYIRRRIEMERKQKEKQEILKQEQVAGEKNDKKSTQPNWDNVEHTKPDELDEVFRKRDGIYTQQEIVAEEQIQQTYHHAEEVNEAPLPVEEENLVPVKQEISFKNPIPEKKKTDIPSASLKEDYRVFHEIPPKELGPQVTKQPEKQEIPNYLLNDPVAPNDDDADWLIEQQILLEDTFEHFHIKATVVNVTQGPSVTRFEVQPALGVKVSKIRNLADDMKLNLAAKDIRIEAPIPGKNTIGIEVPNQYPQVVTLQKLIETEDFQKATSPLTIALGLTIEGEPLITNVDKMPHGLIAGATGSGKSVCINTILLSLLYKADYRDVKFLLIDPKMVELTPYNGIPHLLSPVITDTKAATAALKWAVAEMENRYEKFVEAGVRNIQRYNEKMMKTGNYDEKMSYIVIIIDELADLMMVSPQEVEDAICRIAQKARACGMHLLLATQRPSVDVITGLIKANIPTRIAFSVSSQIDSRTMLDSNGAEKLLGKGDMLFVENGANKSVRLQGPFVSDEEIDRVASYTRSIAEPQYLFEQEQLLLEIEHEDEDELLTDVITFVVRQNQASTSLLQRRFRIGYNRAARLIDSLEDKGIISAQNGSKPRDILMNETQLNELI